MKKLKLFGLGLLVVFLQLVSSCKQNESYESGIEVEEVIPVSLINLKQGRGESQIEATGLFTTDDETLLSFKNGGVIERIYVKEGDMVKKGQLLAILNMTELNAKANQVKLAIEKAQRDYNRAQKLYRDSVATLEQFENAKTQLELFQQDLNTIQFNIRYSEIRATENGYVLLKLANEGQIVGPGMPVLQINGAMKGDWMVKIGVSDRQWAQIKEGDSALISTDLFEEPIKAKVHRRSEGMDPRTGTFPVFVKPNSTAGLKLATGVFARVTLFGHISNSWQIPYSAMLDGDAGRAYVFVTNDKQTAKKVEVKVESLQKDFITVKSGLEAYEYLIDAGSPYLKDGSRIKVVTK
ncbi:MAG TPA: efflux RND transporter periplasmic adaptor subunit [Taishania sp.]|nr:efflux RND transporter periplasmic adaptor subunit [Taishania sp.]